MKRTIVKMLATCFTIFNALAGCTWRPWGSDGKERDDAGVAENDKCTLKVSACRNSCYEADLGRGCLNCCEENGKACDRNDDYSFFGCPDKE